MHHLGADNSHYEIVDGAERCIDDEIPFEIPESWAWCHLKNLGITQTGNTPSKSHPEYMGTNIPFITPGDIQNSSICYQNQGLTLEGKAVGRVTCAKSILQVCIGGSIGKTAISTIEVAFNQQINAISPFICLERYLFAAMTAPQYIKAIKEIAGGTATPIINKSLWENMLIPIPPLSEQHRIVAKIEKILPALSELRP